MLTDTEIAYAEATPHGRRLLNQAIFRKLLILEEWVSGAEHEPLIAELHRLARSAAPKDARSRTAPAGSLAALRAIEKEAGNGRGPRFSGGHGLHNVKMVRSSGLEPPRAIRPTRPSTLRVYQFRHDRRRGGAV
jgi:hypothetical protein